MRKPSTVLAAFVLACAVPPVPAESEAASAAGLTLAAPRAFHTATLLLDGRVLVAGGEASGAALASCGLVDPGAGTEVATGALAVGRRGHTATLLRDGRVLVAGGRDGAGRPLASTELFDPGSGAWSPGPELTAARSGHTATRLPSGEVLVVGGRGDAGVLGSAERTNPGAEAWTVASTPSLAREGHAAALLPDGSVLVAGGSGEAGVLAPAERYVPGVDVWTPAGRLVWPRSGHALVRLASGAVIAAGGEDASGPLASTELWDPATESWTAAGALVVARSGAAAALLPSGAVVLAGGRAAGVELETVEVLDPSTLTWVPGPPLAAARASHTATALGSGRVLVAGGEQGGHARAEVERIDLSAPSWSLTAATSSGRRGHTATLLPGGAVLVAGGVDGSGGYLASAQLFDPAAGTWVDAGTMLAARTGHTATLLETGEVLVAGGAAGSGAALALAELYDPARGRWRATGGLRVPRAGHTATLLPGGDVLVAGGETSGGEAPGVTGAVELYEAERGAFRAGPALATPRARHAATLLPSGDVLVSGGLGAEGHPLGGCERWGSAAAAWLPAPALREARARHAATVLEDGRVLVTGGAGAAGPLASAEAGDGATPWIAAGLLGAPRAGHAAALLPTGEVLVAGGQGEAPLASSERWDPWTATFRPAPPLSRARAGLALTLTPEGRVLASGGDDGDAPYAAEVFAVDAPSADGWAPHLDGGLPARVTGTSLTLAGSGLAGGPEASGGGTAASAVDHPILRLEGVAGPVAYLVVHTFTGTAVSGEVAPGTTPGWYWVRPLAGGAAGVARPLLVVERLKIRPGFAAVPPGAEVRLSGVGGSGYAWSLAEERSGATIDAATGVYRAGHRGGVTDVVRLRDGAGRTATATLTVGATLAIGAHPEGAEPGERIAFRASGGSGAGYAWAFAAGGSGGTLDPVSGVYVAGAARNSVDVVRVTDSLGNVAEAAVVVWPEWKVESGGCGAGGAPEAPALVLAGLAFLAARRGRRLPRGASGVAIALLVAAAPRPASAQQSGAALERFEPLGGAHDVLGVGSADVPGHLERSAGLALSWAARPLRLAGGGDLRFALVERQATLSAGASVGLFGVLEVAVVASGSSQLAGRASNVPPDLQPAISPGGLSDVRVVPKLALARLGPVLAAVAVPVTLPTGDETSFLGAGETTWSPRLLLEAGTGRARLLGSAGWTVRPEGRFLDARLGPAFTWGAGAEVHATRRLAVLATLTGEAGGPAASPAEALLGVRWRAVRGLAVTAAGGPGLGNGFGTPEWRAVVALGYDSLEPVRWTPAPAAQAAAAPAGTAGSEGASPGVTAARPSAAVPLPPPPLLSVETQIYFAVDQAALEDGFRPELEALARRVRLDPRPVRIVVEGHADERGDPDHNQALSVQRAESVLAALRALGLPAGRVRAVGFGDTRPARPGVHSLNRRVEFRVE